MHTFVHTVLNSAVTYADMNKSASGAMFGNFFIHKLDGDGSIVSSF